MENKNDKIKCPVCFSSETAFFIKKNGFNLYRCRNCGLIFLWPVPDSRSIYKQDYFEGAGMGHGYANYDEDKKAMIPAFNKYLDLIEKTAGRKGRLLDIGAATGFFMQLAQKRGWQTSGVEISEHAAEIGRKRGLDLRAGTVEENNFPDGSFDVITMWDALEHFQDPKNSLACAYRLLSPRGILVINTPDSSSFFARTMRSRWHLIVPPEHLFLFGRRSLELLLKDRGFEVVAVNKIGKSFSLPYVFTIAHKWLGVGILKRISSLCEKGLIGRISIPINLRDNIFVIARKI